MSANSGGTEFLALKCASCAILNSQQRRRDGKWECKRCGQKQSVIHVYARSMKAADIRGWITEASIAVAMREKQRHERDQHFGAADVHFEAFHHGESDENAWAEWEDAGADTPHAAAASLPAQNVQGGSVYLTSLDGHVRKHKGSAAHVGGAKRPRSQVESDRHGADYDALTGSSEDGAIGSARRRKGSPEQQLAAAAGGSVYAQPARTRQQLPPQQQRTVHQVPAPTSGSAVSARAVQSVSSFARHASSSTTGPVAHSSSGSSGGGAPWGHQRPGQLLPRSVQSLSYGEDTSAKTSRLNETQPRASAAGESTTGSGYARAPAAHPQFSASSSAWSSRSLDGASSSAAHQPHHRDPTSAQPAMLQHCGESNASGSSNNMGSSEYLTDPAAFVSAGSVAPPAPPRNIDRFAPPQEADDAGSAWADYL